MISINIILSNEFLLILYLKCYIDQSSCLSFIESLIYSVIEDTYIDWKFNLGCNQIKHQKLFRKFLWLKNSYQKEFLNFNNTLFICFTNSLFLLVKSNEFRIIKI